MKYTYILLNVRQPSESIKRSELPITADFRPLVAESCMNRKPRDLDVTLHGRITGGKNSLRKPW